MNYDGFISYSHAADGALAPALQRGLQRFAKRWNQRRALHVFRDETGLSTNPHLWAAIESALDGAAWFVLLASPDAAASEWVNKEVSYWLATKSVDRLLPVVTDGVWEWDARMNCFTPASTAVPHALRGALSAEPRHLDLRWARDELDLDLRDVRFRDAVADLAAPMHGVAKDDLASEDVRQFRRTRRLARAALTALIALLVVALVTTGFALVQRNRADRNAAAARKSALEAQAASVEAERRLLVSESRGHLDSDRQLATLLALEADRVRSDVDTRDALLDAVLAEPRLQRTFGWSVTAVGALAGHRLAALTDGHVQLWDWQTGRRVRWSDNPREPQAALASSVDGRFFVVVARDGTVRVYLGRTLGPIGSPFSSGLVDFAGGAGTLAVSADGGWLAIASAALDDPRQSSRATVRVFRRDADGWQPDRALGSITDVKAFSFDRTGTVLAVASSGAAVSSDVIVRATTTGRTLRSFRVGYDVSSLALDWGRHRLVTSQEIGSPGDALVYDLNVDSPPSPQVLNDELSNSTGLATIAYDWRRDRLDVYGFDAFGSFDAATLAPGPMTGTFPTGAVGTESFATLDANRVVLATSANAPMRLWDAGGVSVLAHTEPGNVVIATPGVRRLLDLRLYPTASVTVLDQTLRPLGPPIPADPTASTTADSATGSPQSVVVDAKMGACIDPITGRIATVSRSTGDLVIHDPNPPFRELNRLRALIPNGSTCTWRPDGKQIAFTAAQTGSAHLLLYDVATKRVTFNHQFSGTTGFADAIYTPDSAQLWASGPTTAATGVHRLTNLDRTPHIDDEFTHASDAALTDNGHQVVIAGTDWMQAFDLATLQPTTHRLSLPGTLIFQVSARPDGREAMIDRLDGVQLVDLDAMRPIGPLIQAGSLADSNFSSDNNALFTGGLSARAYVWDFSPTSARTAACALAGRNLTAQEWNQYLPWAGPRHATCNQYPLN